MTFNSSSRVVRVPITQDKDLVLTIDFGKKIIEIESDHWTTIAKRKGVESPDQVVAAIPTQQQQEQELKKKADGGEAVLRETPHSTIQKDNLIVEAPEQQEQEQEVGGNKKVQLSNEEKTLKKVIAIFDSLAATSFNENNVNVKIFRNHLLAKNIIGRGEFNKYLNMLLSNDTIEYVEDAHLTGFYKRKKEQQQKK